MPDDLMRYDLLAQQALRGVVREALRDWKQKQSLHQQQNQALRQLWQAGITSGSAGGLDMEAIKREARQRYEAAHEKPCT